MSTKAQSQPRLAFVDTLRGLAVVCMIPLHTSHGWMRVELRTGNLWNAVQFFGGLAAPIFLSVAGVSLGLRWAADERAGRRPRLEAELGRGLQLVVLGYALRLQMWVLDGSGFAQRPSYPAEALLLAGYALAYGAVGQLGRNRRRALWGSLLAAALVAAGFLQVAIHAPIRSQGLARVDVLQCIGLSLCVVVGVGALLRERFARAHVYVLCGILVAWLTVWTRSWVPGPLPQALAAYLGQWTPPPGRPIIGLFPLFPWTAYTFVGTALGLSWARAASQGQAELRVVSWTALGALLSLLTSESMPHVFRSLATEPWLTQPARVAYRVGLLLVFSGIALALSRARSPLRAALDVFGRASLWVYWVHLEFAFGAASRHVTKALAPGDWARGTALLVLAMLGLAYARVHIAELRARWPRSSPTYTR